MRSLSDYFHIFNSLDICHASSQRAREDTEKGPPNITGPTPFPPISVSGSTDKVKIYRTLPIFSGVMIPFSIMLSIPSLLGYWSIRTENNVTTEIRHNPVLLGIGIGFSMACACLANAFLVVRFAERGIKLMTLASITFLALQNVINISILAIFGIIHQLDDGFTYGQSFWFTVCATIVSSVTNVTLIVDYVATKDFANSGSGLTPKQRSVVVIVIILLSYISFGSFIEAKLLNISFINALYFSVVTIETIGFGDIYPNSPKSEVFTCFFIAGGIMNMALALVLARDAILESSVAELQHRLKVRQRERRLRSRWRAAVRWRLREQGHPMWVHHHRHERGNHWVTKIRDKLFRYTSSDLEDPAWKLQYGPQHKRLNIEALTYEDWHAAALETGAPLSRLVPEELRVSRRRTPTTGYPLPERLTIEHGQGLTNSMSLTHFRLGGMLALIGNLAMAVTYSSLFPSGGPSGVPVENPGVQDNTTHPDNVALPDERERISNDNEDQQMEDARLTHGVPLTAMHENDVLMEERLEEDAKYLFYTRLSVAVLLFFVFWMTGSVIFMKTEKWTFGSAAYFCFISFTTVGYGELTPTTPAGRSIFIFWALLGVAIVTILISILSEASVERYKSIINSGVHHASSITPARPRSPQHPYGSDQGRFQSPTSPITRTLPQEIDAAGCSENSIIRIARTQGAPVNNGNELSEPIPAEAMSAIPQSVCVCGSPKFIDHDSPCTALPGEQSFSSTCEQ